MTRLYPLLFLALTLPLVHVGHGFASCFAKFLGHVLIPFLVGHVHMECGWTRQQDNKIGIWIIMCKRRTPRSKIKDS